MTLPAVGQFLKLTGAHALGHAPLSHPPVTKANDDHDARIGNATWLGNTLVVGAEGLMNYWDIPDKPDGVSYGVVHANGYGKAYVRSPNFAGCHLVWLWNATFRQMAFLHVYKGVGEAARFTPAAGWVQQGRISSIGLQAKFSPCPVWALACVDRSTNPPTVEARFIGCRPPALTFVADPRAAINTGAVATGLPPFEVLHVDPGVTV